MNKQEKQDIYVKEFQKLIRKETVSKRENRDRTKFHEFHDILREVFPKVFATCEFREFDGSILLLWKGKDRSKAPIMFMNHHDVVEATGTWKYPPFSAEVAEGKIWGRGTFDTKGGLYCMLRAGEELIGEGFTPDRDIYFESTCNEENTQEGAAAISKWMKENGIHLEASFDEGGNIEEAPVDGAKGTFAMIGLGEKGCAEIKFIARSAGGHASVPPKNTPLVRLGRFMAEVEDTVVFERKKSAVLEELLRRIDGVEGIERIRFMTSHPKDLSDDLILAMKECDKVCKYLHLPLQSGSSSVLKRMNRHYTKEQYLTLVDKLRAAMPDITLSTDIIVGFPGETEEDFLETMDVVEKVRYDSAFTFIYSKRTGTPAANFEDQVPMRIVKDRFDRLLTRIQTIAAEKTGTLVGQTQEVLVEEINDHIEGYVTGRLDNNTLVHFPGDKELIGTIVPVKLNEAKGFYYLGECVK